MNPHSRNPLLGSHAFDMGRNSPNYSNNGTNYQTPHSSSRGYSPSNSQFGSTPLVRPEILSSSAWHITSSQPFEPHISLRRSDLTSRSPLSSGRSSKRSRDRTPNSSSYRRKRSRDRFKRSPTDGDRRRRSRSPDRNRRSKSSDRELDRHSAVHKKSTFTDELPNVIKMFEEPTNKTLDLDRVKTPPWYDSSPKNFDDSEDKNESNESLTDVVTTLMENSSTTVNHDVNLDLQMQLEVSELDFLKDDDVEFSVIDEIISSDRNDSGDPSNNKEGSVVNEIKEASPTIEEISSLVETSKIEKTKHLLTDPTMATFDEISKLVENCECDSNAKLHSDNILPMPNCFDEEIEKMPENIVITSAEILVTTLENQVTTPENHITTSVNILNTPEITLVVTPERSVKMTESIVATSEIVVVTSADDEYSTADDIKQMDVDLKPVFDLLNQPLKDAPANDCDLILPMEDVVAVPATSSMKKMNKKVEQQPVRREFTKLEKKLMRTKKFKEIILNQPSVRLERISDELLIKYGCGPASISSVADDSFTFIKPEHDKPRPSTNRDDVYGSSLIKRKEVILRSVDEKKIENQKIDVVVEKKTEPVITKKANAVTTSVDVEDKLFWQKLEGQKRDVVNKSKQSVIKQQTEKSNVVDKNHKHAEKVSKDVEKPIRIVENQTEKIYSYPKLINLAAKMKQANEEKVSKQFWETPIVEKKIVEESLPTVEEPRTSATESGSIPGLGMSSDPADPSSSTPTTTVENTTTSAPSSTALASNYLAKFKIKKIDPKQKLIKMVTKTATCNKSSADYVSPLDKIMDETKKFAAASSQFKRRQDRIENKSSAKMHRHDMEQRKSMEEARRSFEKSVARNDEIANFAKEVASVLKQSTSSSTLSAVATPKFQNNSYSSRSPMSPCGSVSSGGGRSSVALSEFGGGFDSKKMRSDHASSSRTPSHNNDSSHRGKQETKSLSYYNNFGRKNNTSPSTPFDYSRKMTPPSTPTLPPVFDSVKTLNRNAPLFGQGPSEFIWDGTKYFTPEPPSVTMTSEDIAAKTKFLLDSFAASQQRKALLKPPLLTTAPQQIPLTSRIGLTSPGPAARDPLLPLPRGPKTPPPALLPLPMPFSSSQAENRHRVLITDTPDLMSFLTRGSSVTANQKPSLLGTPDLLSFLTSNQKKPSLLRTPLLSSLPQTSSSSGGIRSTSDANIDFSNFDTQKLLSMINPELLMSITKPSTSSSSYYNNKGNLTMNDAQAYLFASSSANDDFDEAYEEEFTQPPKTIRNLPLINSAVQNDNFVDEPEPVEDQTSATTELLNLVDDIAQDESAMQAVLLEIFRGLSHADDSTTSSSAFGSDSIPGHIPSDAQSNTDVTQLKGILLTLLNDPASILQTDIERRHKAESLLKVLDEMELLDSKNPVFIQCDLLDPVMNFAKETIELSESMSGSD